MAQIRLDLSKGRIIRTKTKEEFQQLIKLCELAGYKWHGGAEPAENLVWETLGDKTCIQLQEGLEGIVMICCDREYYKSSPGKEKVLTFAGFLAAQGLKKGDVPLRVLNTIDKLTSIAPKRDEVCLN